MPRRVKPKSAVVSETWLETTFGKDPIIHGWNYWKQSGLGRAGRPDRLLDGPDGLHCFIEWKKFGELPTALQCYELDNLEDNGHHVAACDSIVTARAFVKSVIERDVRFGWRKRWVFEHKIGSKPLPSKKVRKIA